MRCKLGLLNASFQYLLSVRQWKVPETPGVGAIDYWCQSIGYLKPYAICGRTRGNETKAAPTIRAYLHSMLTGDALNKSAYQKGGERVAMALEP